MWRRSSASTPRAPACTTAAERGGVANIGINPTTGEVAPRLEVWLFDFDEDIYGETIETDLVAFLRPEEKFAAISTVMVEQVWRDAADAKAILGGSHD